MITVKFMDGFDSYNLNLGYVVPFDRLSTYQYLKYDGFSSSGGNQGGVAEGERAHTLPGGGFSMTMGNTGFSQDTLTNVFTQAKTWVVGCHILIPFGGSQFPIFRWEYASSTVNNYPASNDGSNDGTQAYIDKTPAGPLTLYVGGKGTPNFPGVKIADLWTPVIGRRYHLEICIRFGTGGIIEVRVDDVQVYRQAGINMGTNDPDRFSHRQSGFDGYNVDNLFVGTSDSSDTEFLGPCRISTIYPAQDAGVQWTRNGGADNVSRITEHNLFVSNGDNAPDGDTTALDGTAGQLDLYRFNPPYCYGRILALGVNAVARQLVGASSLSLMMKQKNQSVVGFRLGAQLLPGYKCVQGIVQNNPLTGGFWSDRDLYNTIWGAQPGGGSVRMTAFSIEKLVSLRNVSFDCGTGSYAF